jgi:hypothetical protein
MREREGRADCTWDYLRVYSRISPLSNLPIFTLTDPSTLESVPYGVFGVLY